MRDKEFCPVCKRKVTVKAGHFVTHGPAYPHAFCPNSDKTAPKEKS